MLNDALRLIRVYHVMSQTVLAARLGISKSYLSELESGNKKVTLDILERYAKFFRIPISSLMLFAERSGSGGAAEGARLFVANKVVKMLDWLATIEPKRRVRRASAS